MVFVLVLENQERKPGFLSVFCWLNIRFYYTRQSLFLGYYRAKKNPLQQNAITGHKITIIRSDMEKTQAILIFFTKLFGNVKNIS